MSAGVSADRQQANPGEAMAIEARDRPLLATFFGLTFCWAWLFWVPAAVLLRSPTSAATPLASPWVVVLQTAGAAAPSLCALILVRRYYGQAGLAAALARYRRRPLASRWYVAAVFLSPMLTLVALALFVAARGTAALDWQTPLGMMITRLGAPVALALLPFIYFTQLVSSPLLEEFGWRGVALPLLQRRWSAFTASLLLGGIWWLWHVPLFYMYGQTRPGELIVSLINMTALTVLMTWIFNSTAGNLLLALLWHASLNLGMFLKLGQPDEVTAALTSVVAVVLVALAGSAHLSRSPRCTSIVPESDPAVRP